MSAEQHVTALAFDRFIEHTNNTLRDPNVAARLGSVIPEVQQLIDEAFLPNMRNGRFEAPAQQRGTPNVAFIPLTHDQAGNAFKLVAPLHETALQDREWRMPDVAISERYGLDLREEFSKAVRKDQAHTASNAVKPASEGLSGLGSLTGLTLSYAFHASDGSYLVSRPSVIIRTEVLEQPSIVVGAVAIHETLHASDILLDGPLFMAPTYHGAMELRGFGVAADIYRSVKRSKWRRHKLLPSERRILHLDNERRKDIEDPDFPYRPTERLMSIMRAYEMI